MDEQSQPQPAGSNAEQSDAWLQELRVRATKRIRRERQWTLRDKLFPMTHGRDLQLIDIVYSESLWASGTLVVGYLAFSIGTLDLSRAVEFLFAMSIFIVPLLLLWTLIGLFFIIRGDRDVR